ncbi:hypothetical protein MMC34_007135 [Xylographa carneopallida]|nr:hypothetical protein [Xylographa carneopallida]
MAPPSQLSIATSSLVRLVKEESSYHKELQGQLARIEHLDKTDENAEYILKQEVRQRVTSRIYKFKYFNLTSQWLLQKKGIEETKAMFPELRDRIKAAMERLDLQLEAAKGAGANSDAVEISKAEEAIARAKTSYKEMS